MAPVRGWMFGWIIGVRKVIEGGARGYVGGMVMVRSHWPSVGEE